MANAKAANGFRIGSNAPISELSKTYLSIDKPVAIAITLADGRWV